MNYSFLIASIFVSNIIFKIRRSFSNLSIVLVIYYSTRIFKSFMQKISITSCNWCSCPSWQEIFSQISNMKNEDWFAFSYRHGMDKLSPPLFFAKTDMGSQVAVVDRLILYFESFFFARKLVNIEHTKISFLEITLTNIIQYTKIQLVSTHMLV